MKADNIITIMEQMQDLPYKCILFKRAFMYSTKLREYSNSNSMRYEKLIEERIRELLLRSSFPIDNMTEDKNNTCYNILAVLYKYAREETETYKEQLLKECDKMESYRIKTLLRE